MKEINELTGKEVYAYTIEMGESGEPLDTCYTEEEAEARIEVEETKDRRAGTYTTSFYSICEIDDDRDVYRIPGFNKLRSVIITVNYDNDESREVVPEVPELPRGTTIEELRKLAAQFADDVARDDDYYRGMEATGKIFTNIDITDPSFWFNVYFRTDEGFENGIQVSFNFD